MSTDRSTSDATVLLVQLARCRRRLVLLGFVRLSWALTAAAVFAVEAFVFVWRPTAVHTAYAAAALTAAAILAASIAAWLRAPSLRATAALLDRKGRLDDRAVTALQVHQQLDAVSRLVVRDAAARLAGLVPSRMFPLEAPPRIGAILAVLAGAPILFVLFAIDLPRHERTSDAFQQSATSGGIAPTGAGARFAADRQAPDGSPFMRSALPSGMKPASSVSSRSSPSTTEPAGRTKTGDQQRHADRPEADGSGISRGGLGRRAGDALSASGSGAAAGAGGGPPTAIAASGGGVKGSALTRASTSPSDALLKNAPYSKQYRGAWSRAQAAIVPDRIPPDYRAHVKDYFVAIRPPENER